MILFNNNNSFNVKHIFLLLLQYLRKKLFQTFPAQYVNQFLVWHKTFGPAQNILGPVKGQGIRVQ